MMKKTVGVMVGMLVFAALALPADRWIHIRVIESGPDGDRVRVNIPLSLAEAVLPTIKCDKLYEGRVKVEGHAFDQVDVRALLEAVRKTQDNQYVTVESKDQNVEVAKAGEFLLIKVHENCKARREEGPGFEGGEYGKHQGSLQGRQRLALWPQRRTECAGGSSCSRRVPESGTGHREGRQRRRSHLGGFE